MSAYNYKVIRQFAIMAVVWGTIGALLGAFTALQLVWPELKFGTWTGFGRLPHLQRNLTVFAFAGCTLFAASYYVIQQTCQIRLVSDGLASFTFWGWQAVIILAGITSPLNGTPKEYTRLDELLDILLAIVWVAYAMVFIGSLIKSQNKHINAVVCNWLYAALILITAISQILVISIHSDLTVLTTSWWYGRNAIITLLSIGPLVIASYFISETEPLVHSYGLALAHWILAILVSSSGIIGSNFLQISWLSLIILPIAPLYYLIAKAFGQTLFYSTYMVNRHLWLAIISALLYSVSIWLISMAQELMFHAGTYNLVEVMIAIRPYYLLRALGSLLFALGMLLMIYNLSHSLRSNKINTTNNPQ